MNKRFGLAVAGLAVALVAGGGTALAAISGPIDSSGVIHGCWTNAAINGTHVFVLQDAGTSCPKGTTAISWNQTGPAGPAGPPGPGGPRDPRDRRGSQAGPDQQGHQVRPGPPDPPGREGLQAARVLALPPPAARPLRPAPTEGSPSPAAAAVLSMSATERRVRP